MNDDEADELLPEGIDKILAETMGHIKERETVPYDGVNGNPPNWVPERAVLYFESYRNRLLKVRGYTAPELLKWMARYRKEYLTEVDTYSRSIPNMQCPTTYPNRDTVDRYYFLDEIGFLAWLKWCVFDLDEETAKEQLDVGFSVADVGGKGRDSKNKKIAASKVFVFKTAQGIWDDQVKDGKSIYIVTVMAKKMLTTLKEESKKKENKDKYFIPEESTMPRWINQAIKDGVLTKPKR